MSILDITVPIRPDMIVGTSVGAINAAWVGAWPDSQGVQKLAAVWRGLKRDDVFPLGWTAAMGPRTGCKLLWRPACNRPRRTGPIWRK